jgi:hypothetical protein
MTGRQLSPYAIVCALGAGGMGEVFRVREARMAARLNHPHVCTIYEVGEADGQVCIAMELVEGRPLDAVRAGPLPAAEALRYEEALAVFQRMQEGFRAAGMRCAHAMLGHEAAAAALRAFLQTMGDNAVEAALERDPNLPYLGLWPFFRRLYAAPQFQALSRRLGLPE